MKIRPFLCKPAHILYIYIYIYIKRLERDREEDWLLVLLGGGDDESEKHRSVVRSSSNLCNALQGWPPVAPTTMIPAHTSSNTAADRAAPVASLTVNLLLRLKKREARTGMDNGY
jgi:hypothetical protein